LHQQRILVVGSHYRREICWWLFAGTLLGRPLGAKDDHSRPLLAGGNS
jgi:hypothetical protein